MPDSVDDPTGDMPKRTRPRRRRGRDLEAALLAAAWEELVANGYSGLTFDGVAKRARTSRPVVHRRWSSKSELARAAILHHTTEAGRPAVPDTGTLRGDALALMTDVVRRRSELTADIALRLSSYFEQTGSSIADLRAELVLGHGRVWETVLRRAADRGEIDLDAIPSRVTALPFDLLRHELLMTLRPVPADVIVEIVDAIFLPLVARGAGDPAAGDRR